MEDRRSLFTRLESLQTLNLRNNHLQVLDAAMFDGLDKLQVLDLSSNNISMVKNGTFARTSQIESL